MAVFFSNTNTTLLSSPILLPSLASSSYYPRPLQLITSSSFRSCSKNHRFRACSSSHPTSLSSPMDGSSKFMEFPYVSAPHRALMLDLLSAVESRLEGHLQPCNLPPDLQYYQNQASSARGSLYVRRGSDSSPVEFILGSWLNCDLPTGGSLNITSLSGYLNSSTDAPNFLFELISSSPTTFILILDLTPRKDLIMSPDYLKTFYEDTLLDSHRQSLDTKLFPEARPYFSSSLYLRSAVSPTAVMFRVETERAEEIIEEHVSVVSKEVVGIWLEKCALGEKRDMDEVEREGLVKRDGVTRRKTIEIDLASNFPRLFGPDIAGRVVGVLKEMYGV